MLVSAIDSTLLTTSNDEANQILSDFLNQAGFVPHSTEPLTINAEMNVNADFSWMDNPYFDAAVSASLDSILINFRPHDNCMYADPNYPEYLSFASDPLTISGFSYLKESHRLITFFYYWNMISYFHPTRFLMDQSWDTTLLKFIPLIRSATDDLAFHKTFLQLVAHINDTHGFTGSTFLSDFFGNHYPKLKIEYIEQKTVVTKVDPTNPDIKVGDVVNKISGIPIEYLRDSLRVFIPASNENALQRDLHKLMIRGLFNSTMQLELEDAEGHSFSSSLRRLDNGQGNFIWAYEDLKPVWTVTSCGYGYVNLGKLMVSQLHLMYNDLKNTPAIIFDVRNYPNGVIWDLVKYLYAEPTTWSYLTHPDNTYPGWYNWGDNKFDAGNFSNPNPYSGKVYILVNAESQSHSEYTVMGLQQHPNAFTIGSQTAGADGNVVYLVLPGGIYTYWTSLGVYYPDSTLAQRVGVKIDSVVTPTIEGIRQGRDEVLEAALDCLSSSAEQPTTLSHTDIIVSPNPVHDLLSFEIQSPWMGGFEVSLWSSTGVRVYHSRLFKETERQAFQQKFPYLVPGYYILKIENEKMKEARSVIVQQ